MSEIILYQKLDHIPRTSDVLKKRTCCKTGCLHCPYGFVIKKFGLKFYEPEILPLEDFELLKEDLALDLAQFPELQLKIIALKGVVCGIMLHNHIVVKHLFLLKAFQEQTISRELVESYFFY